MAEPNHRHGVTLILPARLSRTHEWGIYSASALLWTTGIVWIFIHYFFAESGDFGDLPNPAESLWLKLHGAAAMVFLWTFGSLGPVHIRRAWLARRHRISGVILVFVILCLALTGYFLYYIADEWFRKFSSLIHIALGSLSMIPLLIHVVIAYNGRNKPKP